MQSPASPLDDWLTRLEGFSPTEIDLGLERVRLVLERLQLRLPATVFHVAGTNGKGSSVAMLESLLLQSGGRVGSYSSPHVLRFNERMRIDAVEADDADIIAAFESIEVVRGDVPLTYFEYGTLAALVIFSRAKVDTAVLEIGMGGRLDAVNAVEPTAGLITNVSLDHCDWLGDDVETIAFEKAGIMRQGRPVVFAAPDMPATIPEQAREKGARLLAAGRDYSWSRDGDVWCWQGQDCELRALARPSLAGDIQLQNAAGVLALLEAAGRDDVLNGDRINTAFGSLRLPGRMQTIEAGGEWLLDVAHNPAAARVLAESIGSSPASGPTVAVAGMLDDKDCEGVAEALNDVVDAWIAVAADHSRAIEAAELARRIANVTGRPCLVADTVPQALDLARWRAGDDGRILVTGSFYLVGPVLQRIS